MDSAPPASSSDWLDIAVRRGYLSAEQSATLAAAAERGGSVRQLAVERGLVAPVECDIIEALIEPSHIAPGYLVLNAIGYGGLGVVYKARQINLDRPVALKTVQVARPGMPGALARFQQEAKVIGALRHPNIVAAFDTGMHAGRLFLAMELVEGCDLAQLIRDEKRLDEFRGLWIARQIAGGLAHAAEQNIVHRDIKPANILITRTPEGYPLPPGVPLAKITDFGLALLAAEKDDTRLTLAGTTMGTPHYMAPEQLIGSTVDFRADIFSLGATLYHMFTGSPPFAGSTFTEIVANRVKGTRPPVGSMAGHLSPATARLVEAMMAENPADRPADYARLMARIDEALRGAQQPSSRGETELFAAKLPSMAADSSETSDIHRAPTRTMAGLPTGAALAASAKPGAAAARGARWRKRIALAAIGFTAVVAALWVWQKLSRRDAVADESPVAAAGGREISLFDGSTLAGWSPRFRGSWGQGRDAEGGFVLVGRSTPTQAASIARELPEFAGGPPADFRIQLDVDLREAQHVEILFGPRQRAARVDTASRQGASALRLEQTSAQVGTFDGESTFQPAGSAVRLSASPDRDGPLYRNIKIDHYAGQWRVYVDERLAGKLPAGSAESFWLGLAVEQGTANFASLQLVELTQPVAE